VAHVETLARSLHERTNKTQSVIGTHNAIFQSAHSDGVR